MTDDASRPRDPLTPTDGARFVLELDGAAIDDGATTARYRAAIVTPDARFDYAAILVDDGGVTLTARASAAPDELVDSLQMFAKLTARGAAKRRDDGMPPWPARVTRWRGPGRGG